RMGGGNGAVTPADFERDVRQHADEIISRLKSSEPQELKIFDRKEGQNTVSLEDRFNSIAVGHIFEEVQGEPSCYSLREDSTPLALGLSLLATAKRASRSQKDIASELSQLLDPISALDVTADILLSAIIAGVIEDESTGSAVAALITAYLGLQNLDA